MNVIPLQQSPIFTLPSSASATKTAQPTTGSFSDVLSTFLNTVNDSQALTTDMMRGTVKYAHIEGVANAKSDVLLHLIARISEKLSSATTSLLQTQL